LAKISVKGEVALSGQAALLERGPGYFGALAAAEAGGRWGIKTGDATWTVRGPRLKGEARPAALPYK
jgi:hypothetical protein